MTRVIRDIRNLLDYNFHQYYSQDRQDIQDAIVEKYLANGKSASDNKPTLFIAAGAMGSGKTHVFRKMINIFDPYLHQIDGIVIADIDRIKRDLPDGGNHLEACTIHEILFRTALSKNMSIFIDGTLRDSGFFQKLLNDIDTDHLKVILHVTASLQTCIERAQKRELVTGRHVPIDVIKESLKESPRSVEKLRPYVDHVIVVDNDHDD